MITFSCVKKNINHNIIVLLCYLFMVLRLFLAISPFFVITPVFCLRPGLFLFYSSVLSSSKYVVSTGWCVVLFVRTYVVALLFYLNFVDNYVRHFVLFLSLLLFSHQIYPAHFRVFVGDVVRIFLISAGFYPCCRQWGCFFACVSRSWFVKQWS